MTYVEWDVKPYSNYSTQPVYLTVHPSQHLRFDRPLAHNVHFTNSLAYLCKYVTSVSPGVLSTNLTIVIIINHYYYYYYYYYLIVQTSPTCFSQSISIRIWSKHSCKKTFYNHTHSQQSMK